jgi:uncharacterized protein (DUF1697 family)
MGHMTIRMVALLRGINVGGHKAVDMARLRALMTDLGYTDVRTYLQSGNAVFSCPQKSAAGTATTMEDAIEGEFGFACRVITRSAPELEAAMAADPLLHFLGDPSRHFVGFLSGPPRPEGVDRLADEDYAVDQVRVIERHVYLWCPEGISRSAFAKVNFDRILGVAVTMRNWNTVVKLAALAAS